MVWFVFRRGWRRRRWYSLAYLSFYVTGKVWMGVGFQGGGVVSIVHDRDIKTVLTRSRCILAAQFFNT